MKATHTQRHPVAALDHLCGNAAIARFVCCQNWSRTEKEQVDEDECDQRSNEYFSKIHEPRA